MIIQNKHFRTEDEAAAFVRQCEADFESRLNRAAAEVADTPDLHLIGLSGPSCSGKTTTAAKLIETLRNAGKDVHVISIDDFYFDREILNERARNNGGEIDYDSIDTIDFNALKTSLDQIVNYERAMIPFYNFSEGRRSGYSELQSDDDDIFIFEGIQAIYPRITDLFKKYTYKSIYICVNEDITTGGAVFDKTEIRFMRRLVRDYNYRGASPDFTYYLWESVRKNEERNIFPYAGETDIKIESVMPYEINILKPYLDKILAEINPGSEYYTRASALRAKIAGVQEISKDYLLPNSLYHEFIK